MKHGQIAHIGKHGNMSIGKWKIKKCKTGTHGTWKNGNHRNHMNK